MPEGMTVLTPETDVSGILRQRAKPVTEFDQPLHQLVQRLHTTLAEIRKTLGFGRALAAPQAGISLRIIVVHLGADPITLINPEILWRSDEMQTVWDDCLSTPDQVVRLQRHQSISLQYQDIYGQTHRWQKLPADLSELLQHEYEHLEGRLMIDYATTDNVLPISQKPRQPLSREHRISLTDIRSAITHIDPVFMQSPLTYSEPFSHHFHSEIWLKDETRNPLKCFKGRGSENYLSTLIGKLGNTQQTKCPIICASAGNWGLALAWSCKKRDYPLEVFVPVNANPVKVSKIKSLGARIIESGHDLDSAKSAAKHYCQQHGYLFAEDGKEAAVTVGAATIATEIIRQELYVDAVCIPVGNGALITGIARWIKAASPGTQIIGVVPAGADSMYQSWKQSKVINRQSVNTIADGLAIREPIPEAIQDMQGLVDHILLVSDSQIRQAMELASRFESLVLEPSGAAALAGLFATAEQLTPEKRIVVILTGANRI